MNFVGFKLNNKIYQSGSTLIFSIVVIFIFSLVMLSTLSYATIQLKTLRGAVARQQAFQIAEAGVSYYLWHLAHFPNDFKDGTNTAGPYVHNYIDKDLQKTIGVFSLDITAPPTGSTVVIIKSTGYTLDSPNIKRTITARYGIPSLAKFGFLSNSDAWIGNTENISGEFKTNGGVRFDGTGNAPISSAKSTYLCTATFGCSPSATKPGVWGSAPTSTQVFWSAGVPNTDFSGIVSDFATIKTNAQLGGIYLPPSSASGYSIVFKSNGKLDIYKVTSLRSHVTGYDVNNVAHNEDLDYNNRSLVSGYSNINMPSNGLIFVEDKVWVEGMVYGRAIVAAAKFPYAPATAPSILIPNSICYSSCGGGRDTTSALGLVAQQDILLTYFSPSDMEIDAAMIAQNGSTQHYVFTQTCTPRANKNSLTIFGTIASYGIWTWSWFGNGCGNTTLSGYANTNTIYDSNLLYAPPPSFPLTTDGYQQISWTSD
jgi:hypothetical protein